MAQTIYRRADLSIGRATAPGNSDARDHDRLAIRWLIIPLSILICLTQAFVTIIAENVSRVLVTSTMIPVIAFGVLTILVLGVNPYLRLSPKKALITLGGILLLNLPILLMSGFTPPRFDSSILNYLIGGPLGYFAQGVLPGLLLSVVAGLWLALSIAVLALALLRFNPLLRMKPGMSFLLVAVVVGASVLVGRVGDPWPELFGLGLWRLALGVGLLLGLMRLIGPRPFTRAELMCVFTAMIVTAGISTFGLSSQLVPLLPAPHNPEWNTPARGWERSLVPHLRPELYIDDAQAVQSFYQGISHDRVGAVLAPPRDPANWRDSLTYYRRVFLAIRWEAWVPPLLYWLILIVGVYGLFYSLTYVVLPYWRDREKLIFPLAKLPEAMLPDEGSPGKVPAIFKNAGFWAGFGISAGVWAWNAAALNSWIEPSLRFMLGMNGDAVDKVIMGTAWEGLGKSISFPLMFIIVFTAIGIAFLLPLEISFSIWFYFLLGKALILVACWWGYGQNGLDFPSDWLWFNNPVTAQGGGAMILFCALSVWRCLKDYLRLVRGRSLRDASLLALPVLGLAASMLVIAWWLAWNRIGWFWAGTVTLSMTLLTVGLMRIVAEGGVYWFQSHASFFHVYKMLGLGKYFAAPLMAPLIPIYSVLFLDVKTFMAPNLLNGAAMRDDVGGGRAKFHLNNVLCIAATLVFSLGFAIFLAHLRGAEFGMHNWFYVNGPNTLLDTARDATRTTAEFHAATTAWWAIGAVWCGLSMYLRTMVFWFPHPIGYIMLINPLISQLWFSFFIAWACKKAVVRYGGKATFEKARVVFIGLILGELISIFFWVSLSLVDSRISALGIDLNR